MHGERSKRDFCRSLRRYSNLAIELEAQSPRASRNDALIRIFEAKNVKDLLQLMKPYDGMRLGYNFANLAEAYTDDAGYEYPAAEDTK
jgi:hypothetical protein